MDSGSIRLGANRSTSWEAKEFHHNACKLDVAFAVVVAVVVNNDDVDDVDEQHNNQRLHVYNT